MQKNISVIGVGRLGICVSLCLEYAGYNVLGVDILSDYVRKINDKTLKSEEPHVEKMLRESNNFHATTNLEEALTFSDLLFIYVATPSSGGDTFYDHTTLGKILLQINGHRVKNKHIVIGCTVIPGYIREVGNTLIKDCENTSLSYNPEFIAQGNIIAGILNPDFILIGEGSKRSGDRLQEVYETIHNSNKHNISTSIPIRRMSPESAEITKLSVNCFVTTKISFANMIGDVADKTPGADKNDILTAVGYDKRIGHHYLNPGYSYGGPCFPRDNRALGFYIEKIGISPLIPKATDEMNKLHTKFQAQQLLDSGINEYTINGVGYKESCTVPIIEESQKLVIGRILAEKGIKVFARDTKLLLDAVRLQFGDLFEYQEI